VIHLGLVINPTAGSGRGAQAGRRAHELLASRGHKVEDLSAATLAQATDRARAAAVQGLDALVVVGGDGMVHLGVNVVAGTGLPLGIVAAGTGNDVARTLALPRGDVEASVEAIEKGLLDGPRRVDAVRVGSPAHAAHEWYLGVLSCGFDAAVNARTNEMTWPKGPGRYVRALAAELGRFRPYGYRVTSDDAVWESAGTLVAVANIPWFGGGAKIAPGARIDDGLLDVVVAGPFSRPGVLRILPKVYPGQHVGHPAVEIRRSRSVLIEPLTELGPLPPVAFADGERIGPLPLRVTVDPGALSVLC
jgi:diacylglycerol kinase (ATP)